jgi:hypothetical protein
MNKKLRTAFQQFEYRYQFSNKSGLFLKDVALIAGEHSDDP